MGVLKSPDTGIRDEEFLGFLAIYHGHHGVSESLLNLSPRTMQWNTNTDVIDMRACRAFWLNAAKSQELTVAALITRELESLSPSHDVLAAAAATPGEALLLLKAAREKGFQGLIHSESRLGRNLLCGFSWDVWWELGKEYAERKDLAPGLMSRSQQAMRLAMQRLGYQKPEQLRNLPSTHLQRRFGRLVSEVWQLSFPKRQGLEDKEAIALFPWKPFETQEKAIIKRHLDYELRDWPVIEELLREDLNRLCILGPLKKEDRILNLEWRIVLCNLQEIPISILFRHPHNLQQDCPSQRTALLQINYMFEKNSAIRSASQENGLISWQLEVVEKAPARIRQGSLFQESSDDLQCLQQLENMIKKPLEAFHLQTDWLAEDSFFLGSDETKWTNEATSENYLSLSRKRPLFLYREIESLSPQSLGESRFGAFQERTMDKWWKAKRPNFSRDYYQMFHKETLLWVYRDQGGTWHTHGVYG